MTRPIGILSGGDRDHIDADIAVGEEIHHALGDLAVESETPSCFVSLFAFPDKLWANVRSMRSRSGARCPGGAAMSAEVLRELILKLTEPDRLEIIREAGISDDRPSLLRGDAEDGPVEQADSWVTQNGAKILPHLLRRVDPSDDEMVQLVQSGMVPFDRSLLDPREYLVRFNHPAMRGAIDGRLPLPEVAATSLALTELITSLLAANRSFGADAVMPTVRVAAGSVDFFATCVWRIADSGEISNSPHTGDTPMRMWRRATTSGRSS
jgi:hypothetical protein